MRVGAQSACDRRATKTSVDRFRAEQKTMQKKPRRDAKTPNAAFEFCNPELETQNPDLGFVGPRNTRKDTKGFSRESRE
jgi:hypothetical protein